MIHLEDQQSNWTTLSGSSHSFLTLFPRQTWKSLSHPNLVTPSPWPQILYILGELILRLGGGRGSRAAVVHQQSVRFWPTVPCMTVTASVTEWQGRVWLFQRSHSLQSYRRSLNCHWESLQTHRPGRLSFWKLTGRFWCVLRVGSDRGQFMCSVCVSNKQRGPEGSVLCPGLKKPKQQWEKPHPRPLSLLECLSISVAMPLASVETGSPLDQRGARWQQPLCWPMAF